MAEPLGLIGVVGVAAQLIQLSTQLGLDWKDAPAEARGFILELQSLKTVLSETNTNTLLNQDFADAFHGRHSALRSEFDPLHATSTLALVSACQKELESLLADLRKRAQGHRLGWERLKAAFTASRMREAVEDLRRRCSALNELLQIDVAAIAASTHREVKDGRREQQQQHQAQTRALGHIRERVDNQENLQEEEKARREKETVLKWLDPVDYATEHHDFLRRRQAGTGQWLLESDKFKTWITESKQMLYCPGIPGAGKTILSATVIDHLHEQFLSNPDVGVAYLYCNFRRHDTQKAEDLVRNVLKQLASARPALPDSVKTLYSEGRSPSLDRISTALQSVVAEYSKVYVVVDALDECTPSEDCRGRFLARLFDLHSAAGVSIFVTSRLIPDIMEKFEGFASLDIRASKVDVGWYLQGHMSELMPFVASRKDMQDNIVTAISDAADGMFLLAILLFQSLRDKATPKAVKKALEQLRNQNTAVGENQKLQVLNRAYDEAMERIEGQMPGLRDLAKRVLSWITCARVPLKVLELQHALAVEFDEEELDEENLHDPGVMVSVCAGLVTVDDESRIIRLVHYTTQEYFEDTQVRWFPDAHLDMAKTCAKYLSYRTFAGRRCETDSEFDDRLQRNPLYKYAAEYWGQHARNADTDCDEVMTFLQLDAQVNASVDGWNHFSYLMSTRRTTREATERPMTGLHVSASFGLERALRRLLTLPGSSDADVLGSWGRTPLICAAMEGQERIVKLLLATGAVDINAQETGRGPTPLRLETEQDRRDATFQTLLAIDNVCGLTPLSLAAKRGHEGIVRMLLAIDQVDVNLGDTRGTTPLGHAIERGFEGVVRMLLDTGKVDVNERCCRSKLTPLSIAAEGGHEGIVRMLLKTGKVDVNPKNVAGATPLSIAAERGHEGIVRMLLDIGNVDINARCSFGLTPLMVAVDKGHEGIVRMLLATGKANADVGDFVGITSLSYPAGEGCEEVVRRLLDITGEVGINARTDMGPTPLSLAAESGRLGIVRMMLTSDRVDVYVGVGREPGQSLDPRGPSQLLASQGWHIKRAQEHGRPVTVYASPTGCLPYRQICFDEIGVEGEEETSESTIMVLLAAGEL